MGLQRAPGGKRRLLLALGVALMLAAPLGSGAICLRASRPVAESLERGGGGSHGLPGCSPPVAWALAPIQREVLPVTLLCLALGVGGLVLGGVLAWRGGRKR